MRVGKNLDQVDRDPINQSFLCPLSSDRKVGIHRPLFRLDNFVSLLLLVWMNLKFLLSGFSLLFSDPSFQILEHFFVFILLALVLIINLDGVVAEKTLLGVPELSEES